LSSLPVGWDTVYIFANTLIP